MEFFEAPAFTRNLVTYLDDEGYRHLQGFLMDTPEAGQKLGRSFLKLVASGKFAGQTRDEGKGSVVGYGLFTTTSPKKRRFG